MPTVICANGHTNHWRNQRGNRQPETCPTCGEPARRAQWDNETLSYVYPTAKPQAKRGEKITCAVCGRTRYTGSRGTQQVAADTTMTDWSSWMHPRSVNVPAGSWVCWSHEEAK